MRILNTNISLLEDKIVDVRVVDDPLLRCPFHNRTEYHAHPEVEVLYIVRGKGERVIGGIVEPFEAGDMVFLKSMVPHTWILEPNENKENAVAILLYINQDVFAQVFDGRCEFKAISNMLTTGADAKEIYGATHTLIKEKMHELVKAEGPVQILGAFEILNIIANSSHTRDLWAEDREVLGQYDDPIPKALRITRENIGEGLSLSSISQRVGITRQAFCRSFKQRMGMRYTEYVMNCRIEAAKKHLVSTGWSVSRISEVCGFKSVPHFCKSFKKQLNLSPLEYRQLNQQSGYTFTTTTRRLNQMSRQEMK